MEKKCFFISQVCDFFLEKTNLPENTLLYLNQGYLSYKENKKIYYTNIFIIGQITPLLNQPENLEEYKPQENKVKILRSKYDNVAGQFLGLEYYLAYLTVRGDFYEQFFDCGYLKENSKILYSYHKIKVPNSFSAAIFNRITPIPQNGQTHSNNSSAAGELFEFGHFVNLAFKGLTGIGFSMSLEYLQKLIVQMFSFSCLQPSIELRTKINI